MTEVLRPSEVPHIAPEAGAIAISSEVDRHTTRAREVSMAIDPTDTLPRVDIIPDPDLPVARGSLVPRKSFIMYGGQKVGTCTIVSDNTRHARWFNGVEVDEKGAGFGSAAYKAAINQAMLDGYDFRTHEWTQTAGAKAVWERLAAAGVARVEEPFVQTQGDKFSGSYIVDAAK